MKAIPVLALAGFVAAGAQDRRPPVGAAAAVKAKAACTSTLISFSGDSVLTEVNGTRTILEHVNTVTRHNLIDCGGCTALVTSTAIIVPDDRITTTPGLPPMGRATVRLTVAEPTTVWEAYCRPTEGMGMSVPNVPIEPVPTAVRTPPAQQAARRPAAPSNPRAASTPVRAASPTGQRNVRPATGVQAPRPTTPVARQHARRDDLTGLRGLQNRGKEGQEEECESAPNLQVRKPEEVEESRRCRGGIFWRGRGCLNFPPTPTSTTTSHLLWSQEEAYVTTTVKPRRVPSPTCTTGVELPPDVPDSTLTVYPATVRRTVGVDCGGVCQLEYWTGAIYFFAPVTLTSTITVATPSTKTELSCLPTFTK